MRYIARPDPVVVRTLSCIIVIRDEDRIAVVAAQDHVLGTVRRKIAWQAGHKPLERKLQALSLALVAK